MKEIGTESKDLDYYTHHGISGRIFDLLDHTLATESLYASSRFCRVAKLYGID